VLFVEVFFDQISINYRKENHIQQCNACDNCCHGDEVIVIDCHHSDEGDDDKGRYNPQVKSPPLCFWYMLPAVVLKGDHVFDPQGVGEIHCRPAFCDANENVDSTLTYRAVYHGSRFGMARMLIAAAERVALQLPPHHRSRYGSSASGCQNGPDLVDAQRRRVGALVGPHGLCGSEPSAIGLVKMGIETDNRGVLPFSDSVLVAIIEIEPEPIHDGDNLTHASRWQANQRDAAINQDVLDEQGKYGAMAQAMQNHPKECSVKSLISI